MLRNFFIFLLLVFFAGVLRFSYLGEWSFGFDELFTITETKIYFGEMPVPDEYLKNGKIKPEETQLYRLPRMIFASYFVHWFDYKLFGENEFGSRFLMAVLGTLNVGVIFLLSRPLFGFANALILSLLFLFLPEHILQSQNNRFYIQSFFSNSVVLLLGYYVVMRRSITATFLLAPMAILMLLFNTFNIVIWCSLFGAVITDMFFARKSDGKNLTRVDIKIILLLLLWSILLFVILFFYVMPFANSWNQSANWGYSSFHAVLSFINIIGWSMFLFSVLGSCILFLRIRDCGNGYWFFCVLCCGFAVFVLPLKITYNSQYGIIFIFPFIVSASIFIREVYNLISQSTIPLKHVLGVIWVCASLLLGLPSLFSYYQDGGRPNNRAAFQYVADNWHEGDRLTGTVMGAAQYYIPDKMPKIPLHYEPTEAIKELQTTLDQNIGGDGRLWIVILSSRGGIDEDLRRWLGQNATFERKFSKRRFDYAENNIEIFLAPPKTP
ncbi:MAG: hypothetical protein LBH59_08705 [Planctomycetaceae bacterium]|jgi:hypothetical protein|nr:hypothetical protein [Planctomycetaceae bacterium]